MTVRRAYATSTAAHLCLRATPSLVPQTLHVHDYTASLQLPGLGHEATWLSNTTVQLLNVTLFPQASQNPLGARPAMPMVATCNQNGWESLWQAASIAQAAPGPSLVVFPVRGAWDGVGC